MFEVAKEFEELGLFPIPAEVHTKSCSIYAKWRDEPKNADGWKDLFDRQNGIGIKLGKASGGLQVIDVDTKHDPSGTLSERFLEGLRFMLPNHFDDFYIEETRSGGLHVFCRRGESPAGGKQFPAYAMDDGKKAAIIEVLGEGNMVFTCPTVGYRVIQGSVEEIPTLSDAEWNELYAICESFSEVDKDEPGAIEMVAGPIDEDVCEGGRNNYLASFAGRFVHMGMDYEQILALLRVENERVCKPPLSLDEVERTAKSVSRYEADPWLDAYHKMEERGIDLSGIIGDKEDDGHEESLFDYRKLFDRKKKNIPMELLDLPNEGGEVIEFMMNNAPMRNRTLSFAATLVLFSGILERNYAVKGWDTRANLEIVALAHSGAGKDFGRKVIRDYYYRTGKSSRVINALQTMEGLQDKMVADPTLLCLLDEADGFLNSLKKERHGDTMQRLMDARLELFSSSNSIYTTRVKAGSEPSEIFNPFLTVLSSAIPQHYFGAASEKAVTKGFMSRSITLVAEESIENDRVGKASLPKELFSKVKRFQEVKTEIDIASGHRRVTEIEIEDFELNKKIRSECIANSKKYQESDLSRSTYWTRAHEQTLKLALIRAILRRGATGMGGISKSDLEWAFTLISAQIEMTLAMSFEHMAESDNEKDEKSVMAFISKRGRATCREIQQFVLKHYKAKEVKELMEGMSDMGKIEGFHSRKEGAKRGCFAYKLA